MVGFIISIIVLAISLLIISKLPIGVEIDNPVVALISGGIIGALNGVLNLFPEGLRTFGAVISLGLIPLITSVIVFGLTALLVQGFRLRWGIGSAIIGAIALSIVNSILVAVLQALNIA